MIPNRLPSLNFDLGETADMLRESVAGFAAEQIAPLAAEIDREDRFPRHLWPKTISEHNSNFNYPSEQVNL